MEIPKKDTGVRVQFRDENGNPFSVYSKLYGLADKQSRTFKEKELDELKKTISIAEYGARFASDICPLSVSIKYPDMVFGLKIKSFFPHTFTKWTVMRTIENMRDRFFQGVSTNDLVPLCVDRDLVIEGSTRQSKTKTKPVRILPFHILCFFMTELPAKLKRHNSIETSFGFAIEKLPGYKETIPDEKVIHHQIFAHIYNQSRFNLNAYGSATIEAVPETRPRSEEKIEKLEKTIRILATHVFPDDADRDDFLAGCDIGIKRKTPPPPPRPEPLETSSLEDPSDYEGPERPAKRTQRFGPITVTIEP